IAILTTGFIFGLAPALQVTKLDLHSSLKEGDRSSTVSGHHLRNLLIVSEIAVALVLLIGAGLLTSSFLRLMQVNPGFNPKNVLAMQIFISPSSDQKPGPFLQQALERINLLPGVRSAGVVNTLPTLGGVDTDFVIEGRPALNVGEEPLADIHVIDPDYFRTMGIPLLNGRWFTGQDTADSLKVMVINETMAKRYWPDEDPIGKRVTMKDWGDPLTGQIVGIVGDVRDNGL